MKLRDPPLNRIVVGKLDYYTGLDSGSFRVAADFEIDGIAAGQNLASKFRQKSPGVWEWTLARPVTDLHRGELTVSGKDRQVNVIRIERTFAIVADRGSGKLAPPLDKGRYVLIAGNSFPTFVDRHLADHDSVPDFES